MRCAEALVQFYAAKYGGQPKSEAAHAHVLGCGYCQADVVQVDRERKGDAQAEALGGNLAAHLSPKSLATAR